MKGDENTNRASRFMTSVSDLMTSLTRMVADPLLSKWIVILLAISVSLNGYLLKGIAAGLSKDYSLNSASPVCDLFLTLTPSFRRGCPLQKR